MTQICGEANCGNISVDLSFTGGAYSLDIQHENTGCDIPEFVKEKLIDRLSKGESPTVLISWLKEYKQCGKERSCVHYLITCMHRFSAELDRQNGLADAIGSKIVTIEVKEEKFTSPNVPEHHSLLEDCEKVTVTRKVLDLA